MSEDVRGIVGQNVRKHRLAAGITQAALAERMGVDRAYISGLELGQRNPTIVSLWHLSRALEIGVAELFYSARARKTR
jgi:transcriptional regulator with XRE-family HTH domain